MSLSVFSSSALSLSVLSLYVAVINNILLSVSHIVCIFLGIKIFICHNSFALLIFSYSKFPSCLFNLSPPISLNKMFFFTMTMTMTSMVCSIFRPLLSFVIPVPRVDHTSFDNIFLDVYHFVDFYSFPILLAIWPYIIWSNHP